MPDSVSQKSALISVFVKDGLEELGRALHKHGVKLYSTGGTATFLEKAGLPVIRVEEVTEFPEMMDGRVKTLHPRVFGGILARRDIPKDLEEASTHGIPLYDLIVTNLYPFAEHLGETPKQQSSFVDIGGPSMLRAAAKNHESVTVLSDPSDYAEFLTELETHQGATTLAFRKRQAGKTFLRTSQYDALIASEWCEAPGFPQTLTLGKATSLRYGENPHQRAAWCGTPQWRVLQGKELSYNNILDAEAAFQLAHDFKKPCVAIIKHNSPCGVAAGEENGASLFQRALSADDKSAFGGIVCFNRPVTGPMAEAMSAIFLEVVLAPKLEPQAVEVLSKKKNLRLIEWSDARHAAFEVRAALGGWLVQERDRSAAPAEMKVVTKTPLTEALKSDLEFAWIVVKHVRSNSIVLAKNGVTLGLGGGQTSRVESVNIALRKSAPGSLAGAVLASDAFFPFRDNIDLLRNTGVSAIIQPGGSQRDSEVIEACNELGIAMAFTGERHFRH